MGKPWKRMRLRRAKQQAATPTTPVVEAVAPLVVETLPTPIVEPATLPEPVVMAEVEEKKQPILKKAPRKRKTATSKPKATKRTTKRATKKVEK